MENLITKTIRIVAAYYRVSTSLQEDQKTIENQIISVSEFAGKNNLKIVQSYKDEGWSGDNLARPGLDQLRRDAKKRLWDAVLIYDPDRLARRGAWQELVIEELSESGIDTLFVTVPPPKNDEDVIMYKMRGVFAEYEKMKIKERFRIGKVTRVKGGFVLTTEAPYGFNYILNTGKKGTAEYVVGHYVINEYEAGVVRMIFYWVDVEGLTLRAIVRRLQTLGIKPRKSKRGVWNTSTLSSLLRNRTYIGEAHYGASYATVPINPTNNNKFRKVKKSSRRMKPRDQWIAVIKVPAIIDEALFNRVGLKLKKNFELLGRNKKNDYLLAGKIWCTCGHRRAGEGPQHGKHLYYRCTDRVYCFPLPRECYEKGINARISDAAIWNRLKMILSSPKLLLEQVERWNSSRTIIKGSQVLTANIENTEAEIKKLQIQDDRLAILYSEGKIELNKFDEYVKPIRDRIVEYKKQISQVNLEKRPESDILLPSKEEIVKFAKVAHKYTENVSFATKQLIIRKAVNVITASRESLQVYGLINIKELQHVVFCTEYRNCRSTKCGEKYVIQRAYKKKRISG